MIETIGETIDMFMLRFFLFMVFFLFMLFLYGLIGGFLNWGDLETNTFSMEHGEL